MTAPLTEAELDALCDQIDAWLSECNSVQRIEELIKQFSHLIAAARRSVRIDQMIASGADLDAIADALQHPNAPDGPPPSSEVMPNQSVAGVHTAQPSGDSAKPLAALTWDDGRKPSDHPPIRMMSAAEGVERGFIGYDDKTELCVERDDPSPSDAIAEESEIKELVRRLKRPIELDAYYVVGVQGSTIQMHASAFYRLVENQKQAASTILNLQREIERLNGEREKDKAYCNKVTREHKAEE